jgi:hypothetical protein
MRAEAVIRDAASKALFNMWLVVGVLSFVNLYQLIYSIMLAAMTPVTIDSEFTCYPANLSPVGAAFVTQISRGLDYTFWVYPVIYALWPESKRCN